jgi:hypothetical protein
MRAVQHLSKGGIAIKPQRVRRIKSSIGGDARHLSVVKGIKRQNASPIEKGMPDVFDAPSPEHKPKKLRLSELNNQLKQSRAARLKAAEENGLKIIGRKRL